MARTVAATRSSVTADVTKLPAWRDRREAFSFCTDRTQAGVRHDLCPGAVHSNPGKKDNVVRHCACCLNDHGRSR